MNAPRELEVPGARLRYRDEGAGPAVVLVHGWTLDLDVWDPQAALAGELRIIRHDRRGFGLSSGEPSLAADVADLGVLLRSLEVASPLLVGMSQGARVVLEFAARNPGAASGLVLDGPPPLVDSPADVREPLRALEELRRVALREGMPAFRRLWSRHPLTRLCTTDPGMHALLARILARYPGRDLLAAGAPPHETIDARSLADIDTPTLIVNGARRTAARRRAGSRLQAALGAAEYVLIHDAGHLPNLDAPREYNQLMSGFARRHLPAAA